MHLPTMGIGGSVVKYEEYPASNKDGERKVYGAFWMAQTFASVTTHTLNYLDLPIWRTADCGDWSVSIWDVVSGPEDPQVVLAGLAQALLQTVSTRTKIFLPPFTIVALEVYAIVLSCAGADSSNTLNWDKDGSSPTYSGGERWDSINSGSDWTNVTGDDFIFEEWGIAT